MDRWSRVSGLAVEVGAHNFGKTAQSPANYNCVARIISEKRSLPRQLTDWDVTGIIPREYQSHALRHCVTLWEWAYPDNLSILGTGDELKMD